MNQLLRLGNLRYLGTVPALRICLSTYPVLHCTKQYSAHLFKPGSKWRWRSFSVANYSSGHSNGDPSQNNPNRIDNYSLIASGVSCICMLIAWWLLVNVPNIPQVTFQVLASMLEKGEVQRIQITSSGNVFVLPYQNGQSPLVLKHSTSVNEFVENVRSLEDVWGIEEHDRIPIQMSDLPLNTFMQRWCLKLSSGLLLISSGLLIFVCRRVFFSKNNLERTTNRNISYKSTDIPKHHDDTKRSKISGTGFDSENERFPFRPPFNWDPVTGFNTIRPTTSTVKFKDVAGLHACKQEVMEFVSYLKNPQKYQALGAKLPKGALLLGPPGTGKTLLVKALANEAEVPFFSMAGPQFVEIVGGLGALRLRQLFKVARSYSPAIIFIDELDSLGRRRDSASHGSGGGGASEMEQTLNQLLVEMDGMDTTEGVIVFGATNRADMLDKALLRAGRFDRHIFINLPNLAERKEIFAVYIDKYRLAPDVVQNELIERLSGWCPGMSGADIARLCNEAALHAARRDDKVIGVTKADFEAAFEKIVAGAAKRSNPLTVSERHMSAVHESGRALVAWLLPDSGLLPVKVSIIPRTVSGPDTVGDLGFTQLISEEKHLLNTDDLADRMSVLLGGRAAEHVVFNAISDVSQKYLREASKLAMKQVRQFGMSKIIGNLSFDDESSSGKFSVKPFCQKTESLMELESNQLVSSAFSRSVKMLEENKNKLLVLIDALVKNEVLSYDDLTKLLGDNQSPTKIKPRL
ncbi:unnamed protein product [Schistosoma turkestanicum]|nr:unnamed protein product [Schistosoma turkestanicum]